jgi:hypothetical protein
MIYIAVLMKLSATWNGKYATGSFHDQFEVLCGLVQMILDDVMTQFEVQFDWNSCDLMLS